MGAETGLDARTRVPHEIREGITERAGRHPGGNEEREPCS